jgi:murein L,D-transpeptidase YcbB/YkuD
VRKSRISSLLAGAAFGLVLVASAQTAWAETKDGVPVPDTSQLPPITTQDLTPATPAETAPDAKAPGDTKPADTVQAPSAAAKPAEAAAPVESKTTDTAAKATETKATEATATEAKPDEKKSADTAAAPVATKPADTAAAPSSNPEAKPVAEAAKPANADDLVTAKLRDLTGSKFDRYFPRKNERAAVEAFYKDRNFAPFWIVNGVESDRAKAAVAYLGHVDRDGLEPSDYPVPDFSAATGPDAQADAELKLMASVMTYARHALYGRIAWSRVSADIFYNSPKPDAPGILKTLAESTDMSATLDGFEPQFAEYKKLKAALADVRNNANARADEKQPEAKAAPRVVIPEGKILRPGMKDPRVTLLRKRLDVGNVDNTLYDDEVRDAVRAFQTSADLDADGNVGPFTVRALNGEKAPEAKKAGKTEDIIVVNMERWRWLPRDLGENHVIVNIPDYRLTLYHDGSVYWSTKIVVGQPAKPTPLITAEMKFITVNPTWNVPPSIIENEYLPALREDPTALDRIGLKLEESPDGTVRIWQPPGAANALGRIRFNFPNKFLVYQHDTPDKYLFAKSKRAYSHGCMRVQDPVTYAEKLLSLTLPQEHYTEARIQKMYGDSEININFPQSKFIPVHITYQTAFVDQDGKLQLRDDVYGRDAKMIAILKGERKVADIPLERPPNTSAKPVRVQPGLYGGDGPRDGGPGNFFQWIFGGGPRGPSGRVITYR